MRQNVEIKNKLKVGEISSNGKVWIATTNKAQKYLAKSTAGYCLGFGAVVLDLVNEIPPFQKQARYSWTLLAFLLWKAKRRFLSIWL